MGLKKCRTGLKKGRRGQSKARIDHPPRCQSPPLIRSPLLNLPDLTRRARRPPLNASLMPEEGEDPFLRHLHPPGPPARCPHRRARGHHLRAGLGRGGAGHAILPCLRLNNQLARKGTPSVRSGLFDCSSQFPCIRDESVRVVDEEDYRFAIGLVPIDFDVVVQLL